MKRERTYVLLFLLLAINIAIIPASRSAAYLKAYASSDSEILNPAKANIIWEKTYGGTGDDRAFYATKVGDGFLVVGSTTSLEQDKTTAWAIRLDRNGNAVWNRTYPKGDDSEFRFVLSLADGFLLIGNTFSPSHDWDGFVVRTDTDGKPIWNFTVGGEKTDKLFYATKTPDGFMVVGLTASFGHGDSDVWAVKIDEMGNLIWNKTYGWAMDDAGRAITSTDDDNFMLAGYTNSTGHGDYDFLLLKIDASGNMLWNKTYGGTQSDKAYAMTSTKDGCIVAGDTRSKGAGDSDAWVIKVDLNGNMVWDEAVGGKGFDQPTCITASADGGFVVGGFTFSFGNGERDFWLFKVDGSGNVPWSSTVGRSNFEEAYAVLEVEENEFVMAGWTNSIGQGSYDFYVVKISVDNSIDWLSSYLWVVFMVIAVGIVLAVLFFLIRQRFNQKKQEPKVNVSSTRNVYWA